MRIDVLDKVTGQTRYVEDIVLPGLLHACVLRSPHHHARLLALDAARATALPGVVRVVTAEDVPGLNGLDGYSRGEPVLTAIGDTVRQRGAPVALIIGESAEQAAAGALAVLAHYEPLPHVFEAAAALASGACPIYPSGNVLNDFAVTYGDLPEALSTSEVVLETDYETAFQEHSTLERNATLAYWDAEGRLTVLGGSHEPHWHQGYIAQSLGLDMAQIRVILPPVGGSFGDRQDPWPLIAVALAAHLTGRPVRLAYTRRQVFDATPKRHPYKMHLRIGATNAGQLQGLHSRIDCNTGAYDSAGYWIPIYAVTAGGGPYRWRAVDAYARAVYTNGPKSGQFRGYGAPQSTFALECALDELCQQLDIDPLDFRLANCVSQETETFLGYAVGESLGYVQVLEALRPRYRALQAEAEAFNAEHRKDSLRMGAGMAGMWYRFGKSGSLRIETHAELAPDGHFIAYCSAPDYGQGIGTVMSQLAADALGVPRDRIELVNADTALTPDSGIVGASRATYFIGGSLQRALWALRDEIFGVAAEILDCAPQSLLLEARRVVAPATGEAAGLDEVAAEFDRLGKSRRVLGVFDLEPQFPAETRPNYVPLFITGAQAALVLAETETGQTQVTRVVAAHDLGRAINPPSAEGQIQGAILMGVGAALSEEYVPGATTGFSDYILPMIGAMPEIEVILVEVPSYYGPLGAKGLGEAAIMPTAPAVINGLSRAIGSRLHRLPATPPRVLQAIRGEKSANKT